MTDLRKHHGTAFTTGALLVVVSSTAGLGIGATWLTGVGLLLAGMVMRWSLVRGQRPVEERTPVTVGTPVAGRWRVHNGPATRVPSHGTHSYAQTYAIDLVGAGGDAPPPRRLWPPVRRPGAYPSFGAELTAPADAVVVRAVDGQRDHLSRTSLPGFALLVLESFVRDLGRTRHLLGNHVVLDLGDGVYAAYAHVRRASVAVAAGDRVRAGQRIGACGNSGNSSEPHLHFQLMDGPDPATARGVPFAWRHRDEDGTEHTGVPRNGTCFEGITEGDVDHSDRKLT